MLTKEQEAEARLCKRICISFRRDRVEGDPRMCGGRAYLVESTHGGTYLDCVRCRHVPFSNTTRMP